MSDTKTKVTLTLYVNADPADAWELVDHWVGLTAPEEIDSLNIEVTQDEPIDLSTTPEFAIEEARKEH